MFDKRSDFEKYIGIYSNILPHLFYINLKIEQIKRLNRLKMSLACRKNFLLRCFNAKFFSRQIQCVFEIAQYKRLSYVQ